MEEIATDSSQRRKQFSSEVFFSPGVSESCEGTLRWPSRRFLEGVLWVLSAGSYRRKEQALLGIASFFTARSALHF